MRDLKLVDNMIANAKYAEILDAKINKKAIPRINFTYIHDIDLNKFREAKKYRNEAVKKTIQIVNENINNISDDVMDRIFKLMNDSKIYERNVKIKKYNGDYFIKENILVFKNKKNMYNQCLHLASSEYDFDNNIQYSGFRKTEFNKLPYTLNDIGIGINESYTNYQAAKIFGDSIYDINSYEIKIVQKLEKIIGQDVMRKLYFEHNYNGLINELKKHFRSKDAVNIILCLDYITYCNNSYYPDSKKEELIDNKKKAINFIIKKAN